jgi:N-methylhydantoinase B
MRRDAIETEIFKNLFHSIAEEMGAALGRTAFSPNIKERRDYSCAVFDAAGEVIAMGDHMPVHLGSMPMSVRAAMDALELAPGDVAMLNDPFRGGTHLPDITLVAPVYIGERMRAFHASTTPSRAAKARSGDPGSPRGFAQDDNTPDFFVATRAHHADVGGAFPGSMGLCREIYQEGVRIPPVYLVRDGQTQRDVLELLLNNVRTPEEREGDLRAQLAACHTGAARLAELCSRYGTERVKQAASELLEYSAEMMRAFLGKVPQGVYEAQDYLDDDGFTDKPIRIVAKVRVHNRKADATLAQRRGGSPRSFARKRGFTQDDNNVLVTVDFTGSDPQVEGSVNAVAAIAYSACFYVFRCLLAEDVPATAGLMRPIEVIAPEGTIVNARPPAAVAGGNVETSQRIVDVLLRALAQALPQRIPAGSSGTMNNLTIGGLFPADHSQAGQPFAYYETIAGGMGARPGKPGVSGVHTHMTNSLNTPVEALEYAYPFRVTQYSLRRGSGGAGQFTGGNGIVREIEVLAGSQVTVLADRRGRGPNGLAGGGDGAPGKTFVIRNQSGHEELPGKTSVRLSAGDRVRIASPGGGGWGGAQPAQKDERNKHAED